MNESIHQIDEAFVRRVAALVIARLQEMSSAPSGPKAVPGVVENATATSLNRHDVNKAVSVQEVRDKVVSEKHVLARPTGSKLMIRRDALVTPLAKDTARDRDVEFIRSG